MNAGNDHSVAVSLLIFGRAMSEAFATESPTPTPALPAIHADPHNACFDGVYYIYPTTDGVEARGTSSFSCWTSRDLVHWKIEGVSFDLKTYFRIAVSTSQDSKHCGMIPITQQELGALRPRYPSNSKISRRQKTANRVCAENGPAIRGSSFRHIEHATTA